MAQGWWWMMGEEAYWCWMVKEEKKVMVQVGPGVNKKRPQRSRIAQSPI
jgi:hypothetical protein